MDNDFNSQSDNSSDWKANSRQKNKSRTGSKSKLSVLTIVLLVTAIASIIANIVLLVTDSKRTADTVARIEDKDIETARNTEKDDMLNLIRSRFESGSSTLSLLKELYPDNIVYVNRSGNYVFADINPKLAASEYDKSAFARNDKGLMTYSGTNANEQFNKMWKLIDCMTKSQQEAAFATSWILPTTSPATYASDSRSSTARRWSNVSRKVRMWQLLARIWINQPRNFVVSPRLRNCSLVSRRQLLSTSHTRTWLLSMRLIVSGRLRLVDSLWVISLLALMVMIY